MNKIFIHLFIPPVTFNFDWWTLPVKWRGYGEDESPCQVSKLSRITSDGYRANSEHTHTYTHTADRLHYLDYKVMTNQWSRKLGSREASLHCSQYPSALQRRRVRLCDDSYSHLICPEDDSYGRTPAAGGCSCVLCTADSRRSVGAASQLTKHFSHNKNKFN